MSVPSDPGSPAGERRGSPRPSPRPSPWVWPLALALALAAYHVWDLAFQRRGTGLRVALVTMEQARAGLARDPRAITIDVRLHGTPEALPRTKRVPHMQLDSRVRELDRYRRARVFVLAASEAQGISAAALLARRDFTRVAVVRVAPSARAKASATAAR